MKKSVCLFIVGMLLFINVKANTRNPKSDEGAILNTNIVSSNLFGLDDDVGLEIKTPRGVGTLEYDYPQTTYKHNFNSVELPLQFDLLTSLKPKNTQSESNYDTPNNNYQQVIVENKNDPGIMDLSNQKSIKELERLLEVAVQEERYSDAAVIDKEIERVKAEIVLLNSEIEEAVKNEEFYKAATLQNKVEMLEK